VPRNIWLLGAVSFLDEFQLVVATDVLFQQEFSNEQRATLGSVASLLGSAAFAVVSIGMGWVADQIGVINTLLGAQLFLVMPLFFYWLIFRRGSPGT
jgi:hypothetical protein